MVVAPTPHHLPVRTHLRKPSPGASTKIGSHKKLRHLQYTKTIKNIKLRSARCMLVFTIHILQQRHTLHQLTSWSNPKALKQFRLSSRLSCFTSVPILNDVIQNWSHLLLHHAVVIQFRHRQLRGVPGHWWMTPREEAQHGAVGAQLGRRVEVMASQKIRLDEWWRWYVV